MDPVMPYYGPDYGPVDAVPQPVPSGVVSAAPDENVKTEDDISFKWSPHDFPSYFWRTPTNEKVVAEAQVFLEQGCYREAIEALTRHSAPADTVRSFVDVAFRELLPDDDISSELDECQRCQQAKETIASITDCEELYANLPMILIDIGTLFNKGISEELSQRRDIELHNFGREILVHDHPCRAAALTHATTLLTRRGRYLDALWILSLTMSPHVSSKSQHHYIRQRDKAIGILVEALAHKGASMVAMKLARRIDAVDMRQQMLAAIANELESQGFTHAATLVTDESMKGSSPQSTAFTKSAPAA